MSLSKCFIASAGHGTRMGEIGKHLPKPLWPIFNKSILDLQLAYLEQIGITDVYLNAHHLSQQIIDWAQGKNVKVLIEESILGSGGCIHNLKSKYDINEKILIINADQFLFFDHTFFHHMINEMSAKNACAFLLAISVDGTSGYNKTKISNKQLVGIGASDEESYATYSGVGVLDLDILDIQNGPSSFFETVCNYKNQTVLMEEAPNYDYWDFGTIERYVTNMKRSLGKNKMQFFLKSNGVTMSCEDQRINMMNDEFILDFKENKLSFKDINHFF